MVGNPSVSTQEIEFGTRESIGGQRVKVDQRKDVNTGSR